jgi:prevent-host-death family protein
LKRIINVKELRASLPEIVKRVQNGDQYTVLYRSRPAFRIIPLSDEEEIRLPLSDDPLYQAGAVGESIDGLTGEDHDSVIYRRLAV